MDSLIFGQNFSEVCKTDQAVKKSSLELKAENRTGASPASKSNLNFRRTTTKTKFKLDNFVKNSYRQQEDQQRSSRDHFRSPRAPAANVRSYRQRQDPRRGSYRLRR